MHVECTAMHTVFCTWKLSSSVHRSSSERCAEREEDNDEQRAFSRRIKNNNLHCTK